ncbi:MAG: DNA topoisomerase 3, partial [Candidatus Eremiobacterota bacterium]
MAKSLVVAEKPSVARDIAQALGGFEEHEGYFESDRYVVSWAVGHLVEFKEPEEIDPRYKRWLLEDLPIIPGEFEYRPKAGQNDRLRTLKKLFGRSDVSEVVNACDAGREGELIFRELVQFFGSAKPTLRLWLQSMTREAIRSGFADLKPGRDYDRLGAAAMCRSEADWLIGINATRALTRRMKTRTETTAWSAGRVQTPTLALLVDRELEILRFRPEPFWRIVARFKAPDGHRYEGTWFDPNFKEDPDRSRKDDWITDEKTLNAILEALKDSSGQASETRRLQREAPPLLFDLTSLQREANRRFGMSARRTLAAAQRLYESHKALTYPRTDSRCLPTDYRAHVDQVIDLMAQGRDYGAPARTLKQRGLLNTQKVFDNSKVSDHFAIIPTPQIPSGLSGDDQKIYDLVVRRFLAAFYPHATWTRVERITEAPVPGRPSTFCFRTRARFLKEPGFYEVWGRDAEEEDRALPPLTALTPEVEEELSEGLTGKAVPARPASEKVPVKTLDSEARADQTRPPARISEGRLLSLMEHAGQHVEDENLSQILKGKGLGTPATRAEIIENLVTKQYAVRAEKALRATAKGILLIDLLRRIQIKRLASPDLTGELEKHLADVEMGQRTRPAFMDEIVQYARDIVERAKTFQYEELFRNDPPLGPCPACRKMQVREQARFYACQGNQGKDAGCQFILWKDRSGRYLDRFTVSELLAQGETPVLDGFLTSSGKGYKGQLKLVDGKAELISEQSANGTSEGQEPEAPLSSEPLCPCPHMPDACKVFETAANYRCEAVCVKDQPRRKVGVTLPKEVCKRQISPEEALEFFRNGSTPLLEDFVSRFNRPFSARLVLQENGRHAFEFPV